MYGPVGPVHVSSHLLTVAQRGSIVGDTHLHTATMLQRAGHFGPVPSGVLRNQLALIRVDSSSSVWTSWSINASEKPARGVITW